MAWREGGEAQLTGETRDSHSPHGWETVDEAMFSGVASELYSVRLELCLATFEMEGWFGKQAWE